MKTTFKIDFETLENGELQPIIVINIGDESIEDKLIISLLNSANGTLSVFMDKTETSGNCPVFFNEDLKLESKCGFGVKPNSILILKKLS